MFVFLSERAEGDRSDMREPKRQVQLVQDVKVPICPDVSSSSTRGPFSGEDPSQEWSSIPAHSLSKQRQTIFSSGDILFVNIAKFVYYLLETRGSTLRTFLCPATGRSAKTSGELAIVVNFHNDYCPVEISSGHHLVPGWSDATSR